MSKIIYKIIPKKVRDQGGVKVQTIGVAQVLQDRTRKTPPKIIKWVGFYENREQASFILKQMTQEQGQISTT